MHKLVKFLPNTLTFVRLAFCPLVVYLFFTNRPTWAITAFITAAITDFVDGYSARRLHAESDLGRLLDPVSDKVFCLTLYSLLMVQGVCPPWFVGLLISVWLLQCLGYCVLSIPRGRSLPIVAPHRLSRWNTAFHFTCIGVLLLDVALHPSRPPAGAWYGWTAFAVFLALGSVQVILFLHYFLCYRSLLALEIPALSS